MSAGIAWVNGAYFLLSVVADKNFVDLSIPTKNFIFCFALTVAKRKIDCFGHSSLSVHNKWMSKRAFLEIRKL